MERRLQNIAIRDMQKTSETSQRIMLTAHAGVDISKHRKRLKAVS